MVSRIIGWSRIGRRIILANNRLLKKHLTSEQKAEYIYLGKIIVRGSSGRQYIVPCETPEVTRTENPVWCFDKAGYFIRNYGISIRCKSPIINMLGLKFQIETNERNFYGCGSGKTPRRHYLGDFKKRVKYVKA